MPLCSYGCSYLFRQSQDTKLKEMEEKLERVRTASVTADVRKKKAEEREAEIEEEIIQADKEINMLKSRKGKTEEQFQVSAIEY